MNLALPKSLISAGTQKFLESEHKLLIGSDWVDAASGKTFQTTDPATGQVIGEVPYAEKADVDRAVAAARDAFENGPWSKMTPLERSRLIWKLGDLIDHYGDELAQIDSMDNGKPVANARAVDVGFSVDLLHYMSGWCTKMTGDVVPHSLPGDWFTYTIKQPVGVCALIVPWNYPLTMAIWKIAPALVAGCTMVLKSAEQTPLSAFRLGQIMLEAGFPPGVINVLSGDGVAGAAMAEHPDVDKVAFTGSGEVGRRIVKAAASSNLKKVTLELGGKSPQVVMADADIDHTIAGTATGIFFNMGQNCTAGSRLYAHKSVFDKVVEGLAEKAEALKLGRGLEPETELGPVVNKVQFDRVCSFLEAGKRDGAEVLTGGEQWGEEGYFVKPTILAKTNHQMSVMREEIFGPVLCAVPFDDENDLDGLVKLANDTPYGLGASVWTRDIGVAHKMAARMRAGTVWVNTHLPNDVAMPFGGYKESGWGREMGREAVEGYMETKAIVAAL